MYQNNPDNHGIGSFQDKRLSTLLSPDYIRVDEREIAELLFALRCYAENINFYDLNGKVNGNWLELLLSNQSVLFAITSSVNLPALKNSYDDQKSKGIHQLIKFNLQQIIWINNWFSKVKKINTAESLDLNIKTRNMVRHSLVLPVIDLLNLNKVYKSSELLDSELLDSILDLDKEDIQRDTLGLFNSRRQREERLGAIFHNILNVLSFLKKESTTALQKSLNKQEHNPANGLILSFLLAYRRSQEKVNGFTERLLNYYYNDVQKNHQLGGGGDKVYLECRLNPASPPVFIAKRSQFSAGKTERLEDIFYSTIDDAVISGARLGALKTLFLQRHLLISPENFTQSVTAIKSSDVLSHFENPDKSIPHSLFGYDDGCSGFSLGSDSDTGLVISSRLLKLKQGQRRITLEFHVSDRHLLNTSASGEIKKIITEFEHCDNDCLAELSYLFFQEFNHFLGSDENEEQLQNVLLKAFQTIKSATLPGETGEEFIHQSLS